MNFKNKITLASGINELMQDIENVSIKDSIMLGGGNPAYIKEVEDFIYSQINSSLKDQSLIHAISNYDAPRGNKKFIHNLISLLSKYITTPIGEENIVITNGSQNGFFHIFNYITSALNKKILLPIAPEYMGYNDLNFINEKFISKIPLINKLDTCQFEYKIDFDILNLNDEIGLICISRPTNPTGNIISTEDLQKLHSLAQNFNIPILIDGAYGFIFPNLVYIKEKIFFKVNTILSLSFSKLGLPGARTGIFIGPKNIIQVMRNMNGLYNLSPSNFAQASLANSIKNGTLIKLCHEYITPFYLNKRNSIIKLIYKYFSPDDVNFHKIDGAMFIWLYFKKLKSSIYLYQYLKSKGIIIVSGHYFFQTLNDDFDHKYKCIRLNFSANTNKIEIALQFIKNYLNNQNAYVKEIL